jgi:hypothetical protein
LNGAFLGTGAASASGSSAAHSSGVASTTGTITLSVQANPGISTTVSADGSFTLRGLPTGSFTLVFTRDGVPLGTLRFQSVMANQELTITVDIVADAIVLLEQRRNGIGHGDTEIEGLVEQVLVLNTAGESRFLIDRRTVVARPGQTAIRKGNSSRSVSDVTAGVRVHVKGVWLEVEGSVQPVLAHEIVLQDGGVDGEARRTGCMINGGTVGGGVELEGSILSGNAAAFRLTVNGNRASAPVDVTAGGASFACTPNSGPNAPTTEQCRASAAPGAKVHVSGRLNTCSATSAQVSATGVRVQK